MQRPDATSCSSNLGSPDLGCGQVRIALYSHDTMGLGHLRRNILIASALSKMPIHAEVLLISGAPEACRFSFSSGVDCVTLPAVAKDLNGNYSSRHLRWNCQNTTELRSKIIAATLDAFDPQMFIVDNVPRGMRGELDRSLRWVRRRGTARCVLGLRDVLDEPSVVRHQWNSSDAERIVNEFYDEIWVYGDPTVYDSISHYGFGRMTRSRALYTGYLNQCSRLLVRSTGVAGVGRNKKLIVCVVGGGQDGGNLAKAFASAKLSHLWHGVLITGPYMSKHERNELEGLVSNRSDFTMVTDLVEADQYIAAADRVVAMGGYNTICSLLSFEKTSLIAPRVTPRSEQWIRASLLSDLGLLTVMNPDLVTPEAITDWLHTEDVPSAKNHKIDMSGIDRISERVSDTLPTPRSPEEKAVSEVLHG